jgi:hypothetical protein
VRVTRHLLRQAALVTPVDLPGERPAPPQEWIDIAALLKSARVLHGSAERAIKDLVAEMRANGASWQAVGDVFDGSRQGAQQKYGAGLPADRVVAQRWANEAVPMLVVNDRRGDLDDVTLACAMHYAIDRFRKAVHVVGKYGNWLEGLAAGAMNRTEYSKGNSLLDEASRHIARGADAVLKPGIIFAALQLGKAIDEVFEREGTDYAAFVLYLLFLFALAFAYASPNFEIMQAAKEEKRKLTADELEKCDLAVIEGVGVAKILVDMVETLHFDELFKRFCG